MGLTPDINVTAYNADEQTIQNEMTFVLDEVELANGFRLKEDNKGVISPTTGTFMLSYFINGAETAAVGDYTALAVNDIIIPASKRPLQKVCGTSASVATLLNQNDVVSITATVAGDRKISATGGPSAVLTVMMIAY